MNVEIGTEAPIFLFWEYLFQIFGILSLQCGVILQTFKLFVTLLGNILRASWSIITILGCNLRQTFRFYSA
jgi:hypothetical protein